jgi:predicted O-methyltransferase YrrM
MKPADVDGLIAHGQGLLLAGYASGAKVAVEVGSFRGKSAAYIASGLPYEGHLYCVDPWQDSPDVREKQYRTEDNLAVFKSNIAACGFKRRVTPVQGFSVDVAKDWYLPVDLLHVDGGHDYDEVLADIRAWLPHMTRGSVMLFDDWSSRFPGVDDAVHDMFDTVMLHNVGSYSKGPRRWFAAAKVK